MAAGEDDLALEKRHLRDMRLPPTPPEDYSDEHKVERKTPPMQDSQQLLTPDVTPPGMDLQPPRPLLCHEDSSRANSFRTAREEPSNEFLTLAYDADSQVAEDTESEDDFAVEDEEDEPLEDAPWLDIPGAFRDTPSNASSRSDAKSSTRIDLLSTPSTGSSHKAVRPKQYLDTESPLSTSSSRDIVRPKSYHHDAESPSERYRTLGEDHYDHRDETDSDAESETSSEREYEEAEISQLDESAGYDGGEGELPQEHHDSNHENGQDWEKHVSYVTADGDHDEKDAEVDSLEESSSSTHDSSSSSSRSRSRLSGHGRRVENNGSQQIERPRGINNPAFKALGNSNVAEQGLLKRGSDESSNMRSNGTPSPSIGVQRRRQRAIEKTASKLEGTKPGAREARKDNSTHLPKRALPSPDIPAEFLAAPPRDSNDLVYKHIQQANMDRFEAQNSAYPGDSAVIPTDTARNRHLRHVTKRSSLRSMSESSSHMPSTGSRREHSLRHKKAFTPQSLTIQSLTPQKPSLADSPEIRQKPRSASGSHSLRHEKRPLSGAGRPLHSNEASPAVSHATDSPKESRGLPFSNHEAPNFRHSSLPVRLNPNNTDPSSPHSTKTERSRARPLRRSSKEYRLENKPAALEHHSEHNEHRDPTTIVETTTYVAPQLQSLAVHDRNRSQGTPMSASANSDRTEMEVCEAQNVTLYPHSNDSLLLVEHGSKPETKTKGHPGAPVTPKNSTRQRSKRNDNKHAAPQPAKTPEQLPPGIAVNGKSIHTVESPLTNPREAPVPPLINFIPPTPAHEDESDSDGEEEPPNTPQRRASLAKRARRYSEVMVRPLFGRTLVTRSHQIHPSPTMAEKRDEKLHPNWVPNSFWEDDDDYDDYFDPDEPVEPLPAGGDTSDHPRSKFPRKMSVRMPGFRGSGGFLLGNSLGVDRHGTNKRRHHVELPERTSPVPNMSVRRVSSLDSVNTKASADGRIFVIPGTHTRLQYVGFKPIKDKMRKLRESKEDAAREKRRAELKDQIGMRIVHDA